MPEHAATKNKTAGDKPGAQDYAHIGDTMSVWAKVANATALVLLLGLSALFVVAMGSLPRIDGRHPVSGIHLKTTITRDSVGIPTIVAETRHDAYFTMGWVHAQDRMWQMEAQRRLGAGRLAEVVGEPGLASDRYMRTLGLYRAAERSLGALSEQTRSALQSYADGVNAWMAYNIHRLPPEFTILGLRPEPWTPADSMVWQKIMAMTLTGNWHDDILRAQLARRMEPKRLAELFPAYPADAPVTLSAEGGKALLDSMPDSMRPTPASNVWVVAGSRTKSGKPLLAGDPHLAFRAPILWYLAELEAPGLKLAGATVPGLPFHLIGHNGRIAWSFTATQADTVDLFVEKLAGDGAYRAADGNRPFLIRTETIRVKGKPDEVLNVRETRHGPVISDLLAQDIAGKDEVIALSATALGHGDTSVQALLLLNQATDWGGFTKAVREVQAPVLNVAYADTSGNTGFFTAGRIPVRKSGNGTVPVRGWTGEGDWTGWVPAAKLPQSLNPKSGVMVNANNKVAGDKYPYLISATWAEGYRAARIRDLLGERRDLTMDDMMAIQADSVSLQAVELKDLLTGIEFKDQRSREAAQRIADWDGKADRDRAEPLIFAAWINRLNRAILADELKESFQAFERVRPQVLVDILTRRRHWCDGIDTPEAESCDDLIERSLDQSLAELDAAWGKDMRKWRWGAAHPARFEHPLLGKIPLLGGMADLQVPADGDDFTVSRAAYRIEDNATRFPQIHGAGLRAVFDLSDLADSRFVIATGQSGNPLSRHYADMLPAWSVNRLYRFGQDSKRSVLILERGR
ncbi:penicillin acylase family protein [Paramagnetospirillum caucaseum]|uniref:penicillin acylase family protein n=1 Tax=Paramagnetospirillum caucaseum TaxID=1244869 RepID=UPI0003482E70|nr:penicillin acylase family protein [Paramagnetospirillum caucaseum]